MARLYLTTLLLAAVATGCVTKVRDLPRGADEAKYTVVDEEGQSKSEVEEEALVAQTEERPNDPGAWYELGTFYEAEHMFAHAAPAYEKMTALMKEQTEEPHTGGHYHLGRIYARLKKWPNAVGHLQQVLALQPERETSASLNPHFRESHFLLGVIYYEHRRWEEARDHLEAFKALGGDPLRVDSLLMNIEYEKKAS